MIALPGTQIVMHRRELKTRHVDTYRCPCGWSHATTPRHGDHMPRVVKAHERWCPAAQEGQDRLPGFA